MRVLLVNTSELTGGAAVAASRLTAALHRIGVEAQLVVRDKQSDRSTTMRLPWRLRLRWSFLWERLCIWVANGLSKRGLWAVDIANAGVDITALPAFREADVIHLHWVNQGLLSMKQIAKIVASGKPVVWTLHDLWPCTAICHHTLECDRFETHCHDCPQLCHPGAKDLSWQVFERKMAAYGQGRLTFVGVSEWTAERARKSALVQGHDVCVIPNALPVEQFQCNDRHEARRELNLPEDAAVIAFGAARIDQPMKGFPRLLEALRRLAADAQGPKPHLLLFGAIKDRSLLDSIPVPYTYVGSVAGPAALSRLYSAADVITCTSDYETFGQTLAEAMACGCTPVSFDRGGQTDIIHHLEDGYLARYADIDDFVNGLRWALQAKLPAARLRESVVKRFSEETVARQYARLYKLKVELIHI